MSQLSGPRRPGLGVTFYSLHSPRAFARPPLHISTVQPRLIARFLRARPLLSPSDPECIMPQTSQDYWSEPTDIWFEEQIQNNTPLCHGWAGDNWLTVCSDWQTAGLWGINVRARTTHPFRLPTLKLHSLVTRYLCALLFEGAPSLLSPTYTVFPL